jgi:DNA (cytosine-5)-methyltransferase 1
MRCIDLFAGCGGLAMGLSRAGFDGLFAVERDSMAFDTLRRNLVDEDAPYRAFRNWPKWLPQTRIDIDSLLENPHARKELEALRGSVALVSGGPPCQGFSAGGRRDGADERNSLVFRMLEFVELVRPRAVLIENVEGIARKFLCRPGASLGGDSVAGQVATLLQASGYTTAVQVLDSSEFGVPQTRRRVIIVGLLAPISSSALESALKEQLGRAADEVRNKYGLPENRPVTAWEAIQDLSSADRVPCPDSAGYDAAPYLQPQSPYARLMRDGASGIPNSHRFSKHGPRVSTLYRLAHQTQPKGRLAKSFLRANGTKKDKKVLLDPEQPASTITTHPDEFIHCLEPRNITVREMARLQSFPDRFHFFGRYTINGPRRRFDVARCSQVGNAVPPLMAEGVGLAIRRVLERTSLSGGWATLVDGHEEAA